MPGRFLTPAQSAQYGHYTEPPSPLQLARYFHLDNLDLTLVNRFQADHTRLGFALQLGAVRFLGTFLTDLTETPELVVMHLAKQLDIHKPAGWMQYVGSKTELRHRQEIRQVYGYQTFHASPELFSLLRYLYARAWLTGERPLLLFDQATTWLVAHKILLPGATVLERLVTRIADRANRRVWRTLTRLLNAAQRSTLGNLLTVLPDQRLSLLEQLRRGPTRASSRTMVEALRRLQALRDLGVSHLDLSVVPAARLRALVRFGLTAWAQTLANCSQTASWPLCWPWSRNWKPAPKMRCWTSWSCSSRRSLTRRSERGSRSACAC